MKHSKVVTVLATFDEVKGAHRYQQARGVGSSVRVATARAFATLLRNATIKRKRFTKFSAEISIGNVYE